MIERIKKFFRRQNTSDFKVVIGGRVLKVAEPTLRRYHKLAQLINLPNNDAVMKAQVDIDMLLKQIDIEQDESKRLALRKEVASLNDFVVTETKKHGQELQSLVSCANIAKLKEIIETVCVCDEPISESDIESSLDLQIFFAVDFFLSERERTFHYMALNYATFVSNLMMYQKN